MQATARRNSELSLLILALVLGGGGLALVVLSRKADVLTTAGPFIGLLHRRARGHAETRAPG